MFAARDHYVYPSANAVDSGNRIASFPLLQRRPNKTWEYVFCGDTFSTDPEEQGLYLGYIEHAFERLEDATDDLVTIKQQTMFENMPAECTDYSELAALIRDRVVEYVNMHIADGSTLNLDEIFVMAEEFAIALDRQGLQSKRAPDSELSEVMALPGLHDLDLTMLTESEFAQISRFALMGPCPQRRLCLCLSQL